MPKEITVLKCCQLKRHSWEEHEFPEKVNFKLELYKSQETGFMDGQVQTHSYIVYACSEPK